MRLRRAVLGGNMDGKMILQTLMPEHHVLEAVRMGSYLRFFRPELDLRRRHAFPPFRRMVRFVYAHKSREKAMQEAGALSERLREGSAANGAGGPQLLGPAPCFVARERGMYRWHLIALGTEPELEPLLALPHRGWTVDADPVELA